MVVHWDVEEVNWDVEGIMWDADEITFSAEELAWDAEEVKWSTEGVGAQKRRVKEPSGQLEIIQRENASQQDQPDKIRKAE